MSSVRDFIRSVRQTLSALTAHASNVANPHAVTKAQVGLANADNTSDLSKPVSTAQQNAINSAIASLVASSPAALDTLNELAAALGNDPNFATTITTSIGLKAPKAAPAFTGKVSTPGTWDAPLVVGAKSFFQNATTRQIMAKEGVPANLGDGFPFQWVSTVPASAGAAGWAGEMAFEGGFIYVCVANNNWRRAALSAW